MIKSATIANNEHLKDIIFLLDSEDKLLICKTGLCSIIDYKVSAKDLKWEANMALMRAGFCRSTGGL